MLLLAFPHKFWSYLFRYTFCGLAAMILIGEVNRLDLPSLIVRSRYLSWDYVWAFINSFLRWLFSCFNMVSLFPMVYVVRCFTSVLIVGMWSIIITIPINFTLTFAIEEYGYSLAWFITLSSFPRCLNFWDHLRPNIVSELSFQEVLSSSLVIRFFLCRPLVWRGFFRRKNASAN